MKSSFSGAQGNCIEVDDSFGNGSDSQGRRFEINISETDYPGFIMASRESFKAFIEGVKAGEFDHMVSRRDAREFTQAVTEKLSKAQQKERQDRQESARSNKVAKDERKADEDRGRYYGGE